MSPPGLLVGSLLVFFCIFAAALERPCTFTDSNDDYYDLSPLSQCTGSGYSGDGYAINICNTVKGACDSGTSVCQLADNYNTGSINNFTFSEHTGSERGVVVHLGSGDPNQCPGNIPRQTIATFICDYTATGAPNVTFTGESPECFYHLEIRSQYACPTIPAAQNNTCPVYVYLVPHTHDDVGWIITPDQYYQQEVKNILDTVVSSLAANPLRKFIYVEQAYFWRWWTDPNTTDAQRDTLRKIYQNGQFEFVIGGWVMQDEACSTYGADIDQMTLGHQFLLNTFGARPTKGWQIDPFGASTVTATLNKLSGFNGHVIDRITNKQSFQTAQTMQFMWQGSPSLPEAAIFTEILDVGYCDWLGAFNFGNDPVNPSNVASYANTFIQMVEQRQPDFKTNHILAEWGCDFAFQNATAMFNSMDQVVAYLQQNVGLTGVHVNYTLLSDYFDAVFAAGQAEGIQWPQNKGSDFFPLYESLYWTGYFTSRTQLKGIVREGEAAAHTAEQIFALGRAMNFTADATAQYANLSILRQANAEAQHHDGVSGTSEPDVVLNFGNFIMDGMDATFTSISNVLSRMISGTQSQSDVVTDDNTALLNIQSGQTITVLLYNSLGWNRSDYVRLAINTESVSVSDSKGNPIKAQVNPATSSNDEGKYNLYFQTSIPAVGYETYFVTATASKHTYLATRIVLQAGSSTVLENDYLQVAISEQTGRISNVTNKISGISIDVDQNILQYTSMHSGAYAFSPAGAAQPLSTDQIPKTTLYSGPLVQEAYQVFPCDLNTTSSYAQQTIRLYQSNSVLEVGNFFEITFELGVLPSHIELVSAFSTSINNGPVFFTDDNGLEFLEREYVFLNLIEGNYYPLIYSSFIQDDIAQLTVVAERSHGCSSLDSGEFEVMIHRNPDMGDGFGPGLTDTTVVFPSLRVVVDTPEVSRQLTRTLPYMFNFPLVPFFGVAKSVDAWDTAYTTSQQFVKTALPANVHMLSFNALAAASNQIILRLTHLYAVGEDATLSKPVTIDLSTLLETPYQISNITETTLTANNAISTAPITEVTLNPKQIRTFIISLAGN